VGKHGEGFEKKEKEKDMEIIGWIKLVPKIDFKVTFTFDEAVTNM